MRVHHRRGNEVQGSEGFEFHRKPRAGAWDCEKELRVVWILERPSQSEDFQLNSDRCYSLQENVLSLFPPDLLNFSELNLNKNLAMVAFVKEARGRFPRTASKVSLHQVMIHHEVGDSRRNLTVRITTSVSGGNVYI